MTNLLAWFEPLETAVSLDQVRSQWEPLLNAHGVAATYEDARYEDAVLSFLARSTLPANLRFAAIMTCVGTGDFDPRLALGCLSGQLEEYWVAAPAECAVPDGQRLDVQTDDQWLLGYVHGRIAEVLASLRTHGGDLGAWTTAFWNDFLVMSCRWADMEGIRLAVNNGAALDHAGHLALSAAAEGIDAQFGNAYYARGCGNADYQRIIDGLLDLGIDIHAAAPSALAAAAGVGNLDLLKYLVARRADIHAGDDAALIAAAANWQIEALDWLLDMGADVHAASEAALVAAVESLCTENVETLLDAGADMRQAGARALEAAFTTMPYDLYAGDGHDFINARADMIALLLNRGADLDAVRTGSGVTCACHIRELITLLIGRADIDTKLKPAIRALVESQ
jgi:hypothetical protein